MSASTAEKPKRSATDTPGEICAGDRKIRWLASFPKSGNTWVRFFLNAYTTGFPVRLNTAFHYVASDLQPEIYQMMMPRSITELSVGEQILYHGGALLNLLKLGRTKDVVVKTHNAKAVVEGARLIPSQISGPSVYLIRDPRDVVVSHAAHFSQSIGEAIEALERADRVGKSEFNLCHFFLDWSTHVRSWSTENKDIDTLVLRYEDLFDPKAFKEILKQLEIEFDEERFEFALGQSRFDALQSEEIKHGFNEKRGGDRFFRVGKPGQWKKELNGSQRSRIEQRHKDMMKLYGYL